MTYVYKAVFGQPRRPHTSPYFQMTDRADGTVWTLIHDANAYMGIRDTALGQRLQGHIQLFGPYDGPWLTRSNAPPLRLFIRSGRLGYDTGELPTQVTDRDQSPVLSRTDISSTHYEIQIPSSWSRPDDTLGYRDWSETLG